MGPLCVRAGMDLSVLWGIDGAVGEKMWDVRAGGVMGLHV